MSDPELYNEYYDKHHSGDKKITPIEKNRIISTINMIPNHVNSILEVGCGDGRIVNQLIGKYENICGLDISKEGLKSVKTTKVKGSIENLPFQDNSFDIVMCCEVLEHLPYPIYNKALGELERVSKEYILISVPNNESLQSGMIKCPQCHCTYHIWRHLRSFNQKNVEYLFDDFRMIESKIIFSSEQMFLTKYYIKLKSLLNIPNILPDNNLCPQCGYSHESLNEKQDHLTKKTSMMFKILRKVLPLEKSGGWILALYRFNGNLNEM